MGDLARKVVSKYLGNDVEEYPPRDWLEHMEDATESQQNTPQETKSLSTFLQKAVTPEALPETGMDTLRSEGDGPSLLDGVSDSPSRLKNQDPVRNDNDSHMAEPSQLYSVGAPLVYSEKGGEEGALHRWWMEKNRDDTTSTPMRADYLTGGSLEASSEGDLLLGVPRIAATVQGIMNGNRHRKRGDVDNSSHSVAVHRASSPDQEKRGLYVFKCKSAESPDQHTSVLQFMKGAEPSQDKETLLKHDVLVGCSCPHFLFWGPQYYAVRGKYMYMDMFRPSFVEPKDYIPGNFPSGRGKGATYCKHLRSVFDNLSAMGLDKVFSDQLEEKVLRIKDPDLLRKTFDPAQWSRVYDILNLQDLKNFVRQRNVPPELKKGVEHILRARGNGINLLDNFLNDTWKEWSEDAKYGEETKARFIRNMVQAPDAVLYILLQDTLMNDRVDPRLAEVVYETLDSVMDFDQVKEDLDNPAENPE